MESFDQGDGWVFANASEPINFGRNCCAGMDPDTVTAWTRWEHVRAGGYDPKARLLEQDADGVDAEVLFNTPRIFMCLIATRDPKFHGDLVRAYNDWLAEFVGEAPGRLIGAAIVPNRGIDQAVAEVERLADTPGIGAYLIGLYPHGDLQISPDDDRVWAAIEATGKPLCIHVKLTDSPPATGSKGNAGSISAGVTRIGSITSHIEELVYTGVMKRFPGLNVVMAEVDAGWVPYFKEQADNRWLRESRVVRESQGAELRPSAYMDRIHYTYITDRYAVQNRHLVGVKQLLWSSDYPHVGSDWPFSWRSIESDFYGVPEAERYAILAGNAQRVFRLGATSGSRLQ